MYSIEYVLKIGDSNDKIVQVTLTDYLVSAESAVLIAETYDPELAQQYHQNNPRTVDGELCWVTPAGMLQRSVPIYDELAAWALYNGLVKQIQKQVERPGLEWMFNPNFVAFFTDGTKVELGHDPSYKGGTSAYTRNEWLSFGREPPEITSFSLVDNIWYFEGEPFTGKVVPIKEAAREAAIQADCFLAFNNASRSSQ